MDRGPAVDSGPRLKPRFFAIPWPADTGVLGGKLLGGRIEKPIPVDERELIRQ